MRTIATALASLAASATMIVACGGHAVSASTASATAVGAVSATRTARTAQVPGGDWLEFDYDAQRTGVGPLDTGITAGNLHSLKTMDVHVDGTVDSSAVEVHGITIGGTTRDVIVVTTSYGKTIAIDPATGTKLWEFTPSDIHSYEGGPQITQSTPIIDPDLSYVYSVSPDGMVHKLVLATGAEVRSGGWPVRATFNPVREKLGTALNVSGSNLIVTTGGYNGDTPVYQGHVLVIDRATGHIVHVWNSLCSNRHHLIDPPTSCPASDSAIWARAGAVIEPGTGRILVATGNGPFNGSTNWGDSVLELTPDASRLLHNWTPRDQAQLNADDGDLGSTAPALLPRVGGYLLAIQGGKDAMLHLLNLSRLNGTRGGAGPKLGGEVEDISAPGGGQVLTAPAVWSNGGRAYAFVADDSGTAAYVVRLVKHRPRLVTVWQNGTAGTSPVLAGGLLYIYDEQDGSLKVYEPTSGHLLDSLPAATGHWNTPIVVGGRIVLPTGNSDDFGTSGEIFIYHLPGV